MWPKEASYSMIEHDDLQNLLQSHRKCLYTMKQQTQVHRCTSTSSTVQFFSVQDYALCAYHPPRPLLMQVRLKHLSMHLKHTQQVVQSRRSCGR